MSTRSRHKLILKNARYYDPPADLPGDRLLNVSAIQKDYGVSRSVFWHRQNNGWWPGRNKSLDPFPVMYHGDQGEPRHENAFLRSQVEEALKPREDSGEGDSSAWRAELRTLKDGKPGVMARGLLNLWDVSRETARKWRRKAKMKSEDGKSPVTGKSEKWFSFARAEAVKEKRERRKKLPKRFGRRCKDGIVRVFLRWDRAIKQLKVTRQHLWTWQNFGCQHLGGAKLQSTTRDSTKTRPVVYYLKEQIDQIKEARKDLPLAPDMPLTLTEAATQTRERGPALSKVFIFRNLARTIERTKRNSPFIPGGIPSVEVTPPSIHNKGKPQLTILPSDLLRLQRAVSAAFREAQKPLPAGKGTAADIERELGAGHGRDRARVKRRLYELEQTGQLETERAWRMSGQRVRRMRIYPLAEAVALIPAEGANEISDRSGNTEPLTHTPLQSAILHLLDGTSLTADALESVLRTDRRNLYYGGRQDGRGGLRELQEQGLVETGRGRGIRGYFRPDRPPQ